MPVGPPDKNNQQESNFNLHSEQSESSPSKTKSSSDSLPEISEKVEDVIDNKSYSDWPAQPAKSLTSKIINESFKTKINDNLVKKISNLFYSDFEIEFLNNGMEVISEKVNNQSPKINDPNVQSKNTPITPSIMQPIAQTVSPHKSVAQVAPKTAAENQQKELLNKAHFRKTDPIQLIEIVQTTGKPGSFVISDDLKIKGSKWITYKINEGVFQFSIQMHPTETGKFVMKDEKGNELILNKLTDVFKTRHGSFLKNPMSRSAYYLTTSTALPSVNLSNSELMLQKYKFPLPPLKPVDPSPDMPPQELLDIHGTGIKVEPDIWLEAANRLDQTLTDQDPSAGTTLHVLYEMAAQQMFYGKGDPREMFAIRVDCARTFPYDSSHPLYHMEEVIQKSFSSQTSVEFAAQLSGYGTGTIKGGNIEVRSAQMNGEEMWEFNCKLNHYANTYVRMSSLNHLQESSVVNILRKAGMQVSVEQIRHSYHKAKEAPDGTKYVFWIPGAERSKQAEALRITLTGLGIVVIGNTPDYSILYNDLKIYIEKGLPSGEALEKLHKISAILGLGPIFGLRRPEDDERERINCLFRNLYPREALEMERTKQYYELPIFLLKEVIEKKVPDMQQHFKHYLNHPERLHKVEVFPGKTVWEVSDIGSKMRKNGAWGLEHTISYIYDDPDNRKFCNRVKNLLQRGVLSSEDRYKNCIFKTGISTDEDFATGGAGHVFVRLIGENCQLTHGKNSLLIDLDICNRTGTYAYTTDEYGCKNPENSRFNFYKERDSLGEFPLKFASKLYPLNEVMIKGRIPPEFINGVLVEGDDKKKKLIAFLLQEGLLEDKNGTLYVKNRNKETKADDFIRVSKNTNRVTSDHFI